MECKLIKQLNKEDYVVCFKGFCLLGVGSKMGVGGGCSIWWWRVFFPQVLYRKKKYDYYVDNQLKTWIQKKIDSKYFNHVRAKGTCFERWVKEEKMERDSEEKKRETCSFFTITGINNFF